MEKELFIPKLNQSVTFVIGRSAAENFEIIDDAEPHHLWFHVANLPSCHVIAKVEEQWKKKDLAPVIKQACVLCKSHSKYASVVKLPILYCKIQDVEKTNKLGSVITRNEKMISL